MSVAETKAEFERVLIEAKVPKDEWWGATALVVQLMRERARKEPDGPIWSRQEQLDAVRMLQREDWLSKEE